METNQRKDELILNVCSMLGYKVVCDDYELHQKIFFELPNGFKLELIFNGQFKCRLSLEKTIDLDLIITHKTLPIVNRHEHLIVFDVFKNKLKITELKHKINHIVNIMINESINDVVINNKLELC